MILQFDQRCQKRPNLAVLQADQTVAACGASLERDPAFGNAIGFGCAFPLGDFPVAWLYARKARAQHLSHLIVAFHGLDVPGEGNKIAPVAFRREHPYRGVDIACRKCRIKFVKKALNARVERGVEHHFLPASFLFFLRM